MRHVPVMVDEVVGYLLHERSRTVVDGTVGFGGHAEAILRANPTVRLVGVDRDTIALEAAACGSPNTLIASSWCGAVFDFDHVLAGIGKVDGVLLILLEPSRRPRAFRTRQRAARHAYGGEGETAADLLARLGVDEAASLLREFGEVRHATRVARAIRAVSRPARFIRRPTCGRSWSRTSRRFARVNRELDHLRAFLDGVLDVLQSRRRSSS
jgi:16S rRNA (cytosine1402-N4)-methyltransferase